jgi:hypothetical protein
VCGRLRGDWGKGFFLGSIAEARRTARPDHKHQEDRPGSDDCRYHDHGFMFVRLFMCIDCEHDRSGGCYRSVFSSGRIRTLKPAGGRVVVGSVRGRRRTATGERLPVDRFGLVGEVSPGIALPYEAAHRRRIAG